VEVVETPPLGWTTRARDGGQVNEGVITWELSDLAATRILHFTVTPPRDAAEEVFFAGQINGVEISGSNRLLPVQPIYNIPYKSGETLTDYEKSRCKLDLYVPSGAPGFATMVFFHGGGLTGESKDGQYAQIKIFSAYGIAVVNVNYRLSPTVSFPAYIEDAAASVAWTYSHIEEYGGNPNRIFISGHSSGGYLTAMLGMDSHYLIDAGVSFDQIAGFIPISGEMYTHFTVLRERGLSGVMSVIDEAAPIYYARADTPAFLNICGGNDLPGYADQNRDFTATLKAAGNTRAEYLEFEGRTHGSIVGEIPTNPNDAVAQTMLSFIRGAWAASVNGWMPY
jgi:acetyl esterase/lipase